MLDRRLLFALMIPSFEATDYDYASATRFVFSDNSINVTEGAYTGYKVKNTALSIVEAA